MTIYEEIKATGCKISSWQSDLYCEVTPETSKIVSQYEFRCNVKRFTDQIDRNPWYDIPFAYDPYWEAHK